MTLQLAYRPWPADGACSKAACSQMTGCRTRRLQCLHPLLVRNLQRARGLQLGVNQQGAFSASAHARTHGMSAGDW